MLEKYLAIGRSNPSGSWYSTAYLDDHITDICMRLIGLNKYDPTHVIIACLHHVPTSVRWMDDIRDDSSNVTLRALELFLNNGYKKWHTEFSKQRIDAIGTNSIALDVLGLDLLSHYLLNNKHKKVTAEGRKHAMSALSYVRQKSLLDTQIKNVIEMHENLYYEKENIVKDV